LGSVDVLAGTIVPFTGVEKARSRRIPIPNPQRLESKTKPQESGVNTVAGSSSVKLLKDPINGKNGTGIKTTSSCQYTRGDLPKEILEKMKTFFFYY
jgi:hypothetical protein